MDQKSKVLLTFALTFIAFGFLFIVQVRSFGRFRLIACDVGQGDGMFLITPRGDQILIDGGPGSKIVDCLSAKMPFWDRTVELMISTHAQKDHMEGLLEVLGRYKVKMIATTGVKNESELFAAWDNAVRAEGAKIYTPKAGDQLIIGHKQGESLKLEVLWPTAEKLGFWQVTAPSQLNGSSIVLRVNFGQFCAYLTGDIPKEILQTLTGEKCQVLKVSHHGSKNGTNQEIIESIHPDIAIIQVGRNNYGHPNKEVLEMLVSKGVKILRNDTNGVIEVDSDGRNYKVGSER